NVLGKFFVIGKQRAATRRGHNLIAVEGNDRGFTESTSGLPVASGTEGLGGIGKHYCSIPGSNLPDTFVVCDFAKKIDWKNDLDCLSLILKRLEGFLEKIRIHIACFISIDEYWLSAGVDNGVRRCGESKR